MGNAEPVSADAGAGLIDLARRLLDEPDQSEAPWLASERQRDDRPVLAVQDMLGDEGGEVVLWAGHGIRAILIETHSSVVARGVAGRHVTAVGEDVAGLCFLTFADGPKLYFPGSLDLALTLASA